MIGSLLAIIVVGAVGCILWLVVQKSHIMFTGLSGDASNTIFYLEVGLSASFIIFLIAVVLNHWINEKSDRNQDV